MSKIRAVLFDYDGTLLDSVEEVWKGTAYVFEKSGFTPPSFEEFCRIYEAPYLDYYRKNGVMASDEDIIRWYFEKAHHEEKSFFDDVFDFVKLLASKEIIMGVISCHYIEEIERRCRELCIYQYMNILVGRAHNKTPFIHIFCKDNNFNPRDVVYIGDFVSDVKQAREAGVVAVGITRGYNTKDVLFQAGADYVIENLQDLLSCIDI